MALEMCENRDGAYIRRSRGLAPRTPTVVSAAHGAGAFRTSELIVRATQAHEQGPRGPAASSLCDSILSESGRKLERWPTVYRTWCSNVPMHSHPTRIPNPGGAAIRFLPADGNHLVMRTCPVSFSIACAAPGRQPVQRAKLRCGGSHTPKKSRRRALGGSGLSTRTSTFTSIFAIAGTAACEAAGPRTQLAILLARRWSVSSEYAAHSSPHCPQQGFHAGPVWSLCPVTVPPCFELSKPSQPSSLPSKVCAPSICTRPARQLCDVDEVVLSTSATLPLLIHVSRVLLLPI